MTVSLSGVPKSYEGTGANTGLPTVFLIFVAADVVVTKRTTSTGVDEVLTEGVHYHTTGYSADGAAGTVTPINGSTNFPDTVTWTLSRSVALTQSLDYVENDNFPAVSHERGLDRLQLQVQDADQKAGRAISIPVADDSDTNAPLTVIVPDATTRASKLLGFDADGNTIVTTIPVAQLVATGSTTSRLLADRWGEVKNVKDFGATGDGVTDDTVAIQAALDSLTSGGTLRFTVGTYIISMAASTHSNSCIVVPANVELVGAGKYATQFTRPSSERGTDGVLFVNKNYDTVTNYLAAGNIAFRNLGITDGATTPNRSLGDLIGFGNGDGLLVEDCWFGNHDQHAVDISKSRNVIITKCVSENQVNQTASATYQIDAGLIWGIFGSSIGSNKIYIHNNRIKDSYSTNIIHFHSAAYAQDVYIYDNLIDASNLVLNQQAIGAGGNISFDNVHIFRNIILLDNVNARGINFPIQDTVTLVKNLRIYENTIIGKARIAIFVGDDGQSLSDYNTPLNSVYIYNNFIDIDLTDLTGLVGRIIAVATFKNCYIKDNTIRIQVEGITSEIRCIEDNDNEHIEISGNLIEIVGANTTNTSIYGIQIYADFASANNLTKTGIVDNNTFRGTNFRYNISTSNTGTPTDDALEIVISRNNFRASTVVVANMYLIRECSDGTNNLGYIDFTGVTGVSSNKRILALTASSFLEDIPMAGTVSGNAGVQANVFFKKIFSPGVSGFQYNSEELELVYLSSSTVAGTQIVDIDLPNGTFAILTGVSGVSCVINNSTFQPVIRTTGYLKVLCGI